MLELTGNVRMKTDVLIIGGGILGTTTARELSKYNADVTLVEKEADFGAGCSKASFCLVNQGADALEFRKGYKRSELLWKSMDMMEPLCKELDVPFEKIGALGLYKNDVEKMKFFKMDSRAREWADIEHEWIDKEKLFEMEPNLTEDAKGALYDPEAAITDPVRLSMALAENAEENGVEMMLNTEVSDITRRLNKFEVKVDGGRLRANILLMPQERTLTR